MRLRSILVRLSVDSPICFRVSLSSMLMAPSHRHRSVMRRRLTLFDSNVHIMITATRYIKTVEFYTELV